MSLRRQGPWGSREKLRSATGRKKKTGFWTQLSLELCCVKEGGLDGSPRETWSLGKGLLPWETLATGVIWWRGRKGRSREKGKEGTELGKPDRVRPRDRGEELAFHRRVLSSPLCVCLCWASRWRGFKMAPVS